MYIQGLVKIFEKAWALTALALIKQGTPARIAVLAAAAGTTRSAMRPSVLHLQELGLLAPNKGHGHPLRPEAKLTPTGEFWARLALNLDRLLSGEQERRLVRLNWTLPTLRAVHSPARFTSIRQALGPVSDSALSTTLQRLETTAWLERQVDIGVKPPKVTYASINQGRAIAKLLSKNVMLSSQ